MSSLEGGNEILIKELTNINKNTDNICFSFSLAPYALRLQPFTLSLSYIAPPVQ